MEQQPSIDYYVMFSDLVKRHTELSKRRNDIDLEIAKLKQLILATFPLLPAEKQEIFQKEIEELEEQSAGLLNAIKLVFSNRKGEWLSAVNVREHLNTMGFDLTQYRANPLASITTTLKRMVPGHLESHTAGDGQVFYKRRLTLLDQLGRGDHALSDLSGGTKVSIGGVSAGTKVKEALSRLGSSHPSKLGHPNPTGTQTKKKNSAFYGE